jgi:hypothetical protein
MDLVNDNASYSLSLSLPLSLSLSTKPTPISIKVYSHCKGFIVNFILYVIVEQSIISQTPLDDRN